MGTISEVTTELERGIQKVIGEILPQTRGYAIEAEIRENDRKKRSTASVESWNPAAGEIVITFGHPSEADWAEYYPADGGVGNKMHSLREPAVAAQVGLEELIRALDEAEQRPGFDFVSLKWFRDLFLPARGYAWSQADRDDAIRQAVEANVVTTRKVPNPKSPAFPVTAISLNRQHPDVQVALGEASCPADFEPVAVRGEALSTTILRDRR